jgi:hypothetical protein
MMANIDRVCAFHQTDGYDPALESSRPGRPTNGPLIALGGQEPRARLATGVDRERSRELLLVFLHELAWWDSRRYVPAALKLKMACAGPRTRIAEDGWTRGKDTHHR